jgi:hypothetical protein
MQLKVDCLRTCAVLAFFSLMGMLAFDLTISGIIFIPEILQILALSIIINIISYGLRFLSLSKQTYGFIIKHAPTESCSGLKKFSQFIESSIKSVYTASILIILLEVMAIALSWSSLDEMMISIFVPCRIALYGVVISEVFLRSIKRAIELAIKDSRHAPTNSTP